MTALRPTALDAILEPGTGPCVSIYLPTNRTGREQQQDRIRVKNLLRQASRGPEGIAIPGSHAEAVLAAGRGSAMTLQRRLGIGHGRGLRLLQHMEAVGIVGSQGEAGARDLCIAPSDWEAFSNSNAS